MTIRCHRKLRRLVFKFHESRHHHAYISKLRVTVDRNRLIPFHSKYWSFTWFKMLTHISSQIPITTSLQLSTWQQKSFENHLSRGLSRHLTHGSGHVTPSRNVMSSQPHVTSPVLTSRGFHHAGCGKCRKRKHSGNCDSKDCAGVSG